MLVNRGTLYLRVRLTRVIRLYGTHFA
jgi:hypothetical protein